MNNDDRKFETCKVNPDRPIKAHLDEKMRAHIEYALRRHLVELNTFIERTKKNRSLDEQRRRFQLAGLDSEIELTQVCIRELTQAGT